MVPQQDLPHLFAWAQANHLALFPIPAWSKQPVGVLPAHLSHVDGWSMDPGQWRAWYEQTGGCNFGVACGQSRLIVVDVDVGGFPKFVAWREQNGVHEPASLTVVTPTGGLHEYFSVPEGTDACSLRQPNLCGKEVNVRAGHGYVVSPWSRTAKSQDSGVKADGQYQLSLGSLIRAAPDALIDHCLPTKQDEPAIVPEQEADLDFDGLPKSFHERAQVNGRLMPIMSRLLEAVPGERNEKLNQAAFDLGKIVAAGNLAEWRAVELLEEACEKLGAPRDDQKARSTIRSGLRAAPRVGRPEPRSAMAALLAAAVPVGPVRPRAPRRPPFPDTLEPLEPVVERLLYRGMITVLAGASGSGKTTFMASLVASSVGDVRDFIVGPGINGSDVLIYPCCWVFVSYEGGQHIRRTTAAWHVGAECAQVHPDRCEFLSFDDGCLVGSGERNRPVVNQAQAEAVTGALSRMRERFPGMPVALVLDNASAAIEDDVDRPQVQTFMRAMRAIARDDVAVVILAHPTKSGSSAVIGSHLLQSLADVGATIEVLRDEDSEWVQWIEFWKHREASNGKCLEVRSHRIGRPLVELPAAWGGGNERARARQIRDLHVPFVSSIRVRGRRDKESVAKGVQMVNDVSAKPEATVRT